MQKWLGRFDGGFLCLHHITSWFQTEYLQGKVNVLLKSIKLVRNWWVPLHGIKLCKIHIPFLYIFSQASPYPLRHSQATSPAQELQTHPEPHRCLCLRTASSWDETRGFSCSIRDWGTVNTDSKYSPTRARIQECCPQATWRMNLRWHLQAMCGIFKEDYSTETEEIGIYRS